MLTKYILIIFSILIFLTIAFSFIRKKYNSHSMYKLTNLLIYFLELLVKSRLLCKMLYNVFTISTYQN